MPNLRQAGEPYLFRDVNSDMFYVVRGKFQRTLDTKIKKEARAHPTYVRIRSAAEVDLPRNSTKIRHGEAFDEFIKRGIGPKGGGKILSPSYKRKLKQLYNDHARDLIGEKRVIDVTPRHIILILERTRRGSEDFDPEHELKESQRRNLYVMLSSSCEMMTMEPMRYASTNPVRAIGSVYRPPEPESKPVADEVLFSRKEVEQIADSFWRDQEQRAGTFTASKRLAYTNRVVFLLLCQSGMRIAECLALKLSDVFYEPLEEDGPLRLMHQPAELPYMIVLTQALNTNYDETVGAAFKADEPTTWFVGLKGDSGKTTGKARRIGLSPFIGRVLREYIDTGEREGWLRHDGLLFPNTKLKPCSTSHFWSRLQAAIKQVGIERPMTTHYTRHTYLSQLAENVNLEENEIAEVAGQSKEVLVARYWHRRPGSQSYKKIAQAGWA